ncbi:SusC/RagA family TonB-linked outer membrane protein [Olivibacter sp. SDN3]|uniref:SusC/RagA family TonB-linked outer membrane protein n=1 Tax=Olivibacter sp. SDN3 TaxID=2764720 RepID=UPI002102BD5E|nr:SusC/RagA family TonB-linked outer membrane protein [Olivibacter sp. SDN3]
MYAYLDASLWQKLLKVASANRRLRPAAKDLLLFAVFCFASLMGNASYSQQITLNAKNTAFKDVFQQIEKQTGYTFFYKKSDLEGLTLKEVSVKNAPLEEALAILFTDQPITYDLEDKIIIVKEKPKIAETAFAEAQSLSTPKQQTVSGVVTDSIGQTLSGVSVVVKSSGRGTSTDAEGRYAIDVAPGEILIFKSVGYVTQEITTESQTRLDLVLTAEFLGLDEVVVIGYGTVRKADLTGSVSQVKPEEIKSFPTANVLQALSGRAAGVQVRQASGAPGSTMDVRIRGNNSIEGGNEPLYVIDGFPISGNPTNLNNNDIESIEILKDASATAIYGSRGASGVVLITTRKGREGQTRVGFESSFSSQQLIRKLDLMNAREYALFYNQRAINDNAQPFFSDSDIESFDEGFDWQDFVFRSAPMFTAGLNVHGGNEKTQFALSGSLFDQKGIVEGSNYKRYSLQANIQHKISDKFNISFSTVLSKLNTDRRDSGGGSRGNSMISAAVSAPPTVTPYNDDGSYRVLNAVYPFIATDIINPINFIREDNMATRANSVLANLGLTYNITPDLFLKIAGGIENRDDRTDRYRTRQFFNSLGVANVGTSQFTSLLNENTLNYSKTFNEKHQLSAVIGATYQDFKTTVLNNGGVGFISDVFGTDNLGVAITPGVPGSVDANSAILPYHIPGSSYEKSTMLSFLGRVNYTYNDKYLLTASLRRDGSSRYSRGDKWGYFPSAALAWRVSQEDFLRDHATISDLKLRTSWGKTGSQAINPYQTLNLLQAGRTIFNGEFANTLAPGSRLPQNLRWETTEQIDVGLDLGLWSNRVLFTADYYIKNTTDLLNTVRLPSSLGYTTTILNVGEVQNKGLEFGLNAQVFNNVFKWNVNANVAFNRNKVIRLNDGEDILRDQVNVVAINDATSILREGRPLGQFWGYQEEGYDATGRILFKDINGDGNISQLDKTYIGDPNPDFIFGFNSNMHYKNFELTIFLQGSVGNDIFNTSAITNTMDYGFGLNMPKDVLYDHWSPENPNAKYPIISNNSPIRVSDRFVEDGTYLRLKNIQLAYDLPVEKLNISWMNSMRVYVSGQNLLTFTGYSWWDPETNYRMDHSSYPASKGVTFGLTAGF